MKDIKRWVTVSVPRSVDVVLGDFVHMISMTDKAPYAMFVAAMHRPVTSNAINASKEFDDTENDLEKLVGNKRGVKEKGKPKIDANKGKKRSRKTDYTSKDVQDVPQSKDKADSKWTKKSRKLLRYHMNQIIQSGRQI